MSVLHGDPRQYSVEASGGVLGVKHGLASYAVLGYFGSELVENLYFAAISSIGEFLHIIGRKENLLAAQQQRPEVAAISMCLR